MAELSIRRAHASDEWADTELAGIARVLQETTGLVFPANRRRPAEAGIRRTMGQLGLDGAALRRAIAAPGDARDALVTELTIGETYFFREVEQLDFVRDNVLPVLLERIGATRRLRIWSAGSATGEEAYALAMLLREAAWPWPSAILGTDLVPARLATARRGLYAQWSMRGVPDAMIERYFEKEGKHFVLREDIRRAVEFRVLNLATDDYPSERSGVVDMDIIFCRNVLIYLDTPNVEAIARRLMASLAPDGWLFLGASDPVIADIVPCEVVLTGGGVAYRPIASGAVASRHVVMPVLAVDAAAPAGTGQPAEGADHHETKVVEHSLAIGELSDGALANYEHAYRGADYERAAITAREAIDRGTAPERAWTVLIRSLANEGHLDAAGEAAAAALDHHQMSAEVSYLNGVLLAQSGRHGESAAAFRRALYLDSQFAIAHLALGGELFAVGDEEGARRAYVNAESVLREIGPDTVVAGADGVPVSRLLHIARHHLQSLPDGRARSQQREAM